MPGHQEQLRTCLHHAANVWGLQSGNCWVLDDVLNQQRVDSSQSLIPCISVLQGQYKELQEQYIALKAQKVVELEELVAGHVSVNSGPSTTSILRNKAVKIVRVPNCHMCTVSQLSDKQRLGEASCEQLQDVVRSGVCWRCFACHCFDLTVSCRILLSILCCVILKNHVMCK